MFSSLFVCLLATLRKNFQTDLHEISREGWQWASEQTIKLEHRLVTDGQTDGQTQSDTKTANTADSYRRAGENRYS